MLELRHIEGIGQKAHVKDKVRLQWDTVLVAERHHVHAQLAARALVAKDAIELISELCRRHLRRVDDHVRALTQRAQELLLAVHRLLDAHAVGHERMAAARLLVALDDGLQIRRDKKQAADVAALLQPVHRVEKARKVPVPRTDVAHERDAVIAAVALRAERRKLEHDVRRNIVHRKIAHILQIRRGARFSRTRQPGYDQNFHLSPLPAG